MKWKEYGSFTNENKRKMLGGKKKKKKHDLLLYHVHLLSEKKKMNDFVLFYLVSPLLFCDTLYKKDPI